MSFISIVQHINIHQRNLAGRRGKGGKKQQHEYQNSTVFPLQNRKSHHVLFCSQGQTVLGELVQKAALVH